MSKEDGRNVEDAETWDFEQPTVREPVKTPRVVVSVAFRRDDFVRVSAYAEQVGRKVSEFIREAAIEKVSGWTDGFFYGSGSAGTLWAVSEQATMTRGWASPIGDLGEAVTTY
jgi:hypothetical protein